MNVFSYEILFSDFINAKATVFIEICVESVLPSPGTPVSSYSTKLGKLETLIFPYV